MSGPGEAARRSPAPTASPRRRPGIGLRREVGLLFPAALVILAALAIFTLLAYRGALQLLLEERRAEAERLARAAATALRDSPALTPEALRALAPTAAGVALLDEQGLPLAVTGDVPSIGLPAALAAPGAVTAAVGPGPLLTNGVAGFARSQQSGRTLWVRVDLPAAGLAAQRRALRILVPLVVGVTLAVSLLVLLFLGHLLAPYETLLERAKQAGEAPAAGEDEVTALVSTFERALAALRSGAPEDDFAALERALAPSLESGLLLLDREGRVLALNPAGAALIGTAAPPVGTPLPTALAAQPALAALLVEALAAGHGAARREAEITVAGSRRQLGLTLHPLRREAGDVRGYVVLFADLTEIRRREDEARRAQNLAQLGELTAGLAHELRNSLATMRGYLTLIDRSGGAAGVAEHVTEIRRETDHLQRVLEDFLSFARPGSVRLQEVDLESLVHRAAADPALGGALVHIHRPLAGALPPSRLRADPQLLERALRNLLHNAVEAHRAAGSPGAVEARLMPAAGGYEVHIEDRGAGVPAEVAARLFEPFAAGRPGGVGLGLALAHRIVTLHGGRLRLEPRPDGGTRAAVFLPTTGELSPPS